MHTTHTYCIYANVYERYCTHIHACILTNTTNEYAIIEISLMNDWVETLEMTIELN